MHQLLGLILSSILIVGACTKEPTVGLEQDTGFTGSGDLNPVEDSQRFEEWSVLTDGDLEEELVLSGLVAIENPANVLSYFIEWQTEIPASTELEVDCDDLFQVVVIEGEPIYETNHSVFLMGLIEGASCMLLARSVDQNGRSGAASLQLNEVGPLPEDLPAYTATTYQLEERATGWSLFGVSSRQYAANESPVFLAVIDDAGRYRWYHRREGTGPALGPWDVSLYNGNILAAGRGPIKAAIIGWSGELIWEAGFTMHHDIQPSPYTEDALIYLGYSAQNCPEETIEGTVVEFDLISEQALWTWYVCDHYVPESVYNDWSHLNDVEPIVEEDAMLVSSRHQSTIFKVNRTTGELLWILGGEQNQFEFADDAVFYQQHAPHLLDNGNILIFDNGMNGVREYSRALELSLSFDATGSPGRVDVAWDYTDEAHYADARSEAERLENGNTQLTYSLLAETGESMILEVTPFGEEVWELRTPPDWNLYRSERIDIPSFAWINRQEE
jgi:hypothetical protein